MIRLQILEHQFLSLTNVIKYKTTSDHKNIPEIINYLKNGVRQLGAEPNDKLVVTDKGKGEYEFLIPVNKTILSSKEYSFSPLFDLLNAIKIRHEGSFSNINKTRANLIDYIRKKKYIISSETYYRFIRVSEHNSNDCIIDIYIGIK